MSQGSESLCDELGIRIAFNGRCYPQTKCLFSCHSSPEKLSQNGINPKYLCSPDSSDIVRTDKTGLESCIRRHLQYLSTFRYVIKNDTLGLILVLGASFSDCLLVKIL